LFLTVYNGAGNFNAEAITAGWGDPWDIMDPGLAIKQYPCCGSTHPAIDAMLMLVREHDLKPDDVTRIDAWTHKRHHVKLEDLCALSAWQDSYIEFVLMEVFGVFLLAPMVFPLPWAFLMLTAAYNGVNAAIDHCGFKVPDSHFDGLYHYVHHVLPDRNFAEMEMLDRYMGTLGSLKEASK